MAARPLARCRELVPCALHASIALLASVYAVAELSTPAPGDAYSTGLAETGSASSPAPPFSLVTQVLTLGEAASAIAS